MSGEAEKVTLVQVRQLEIDLAAGPVLPGLLCKRPGRGRGVAGKVIRGAKVSRPGLRRPAAIQRSASGSCEIWICVIDLAHRQAEIRPLGYSTLLLPERVGKAVQSRGDERRCRIAMAPRSTHRPQQALTQHCDFIRYLEPTTASTRSLFPLRPET